MRRRRRRRVVAKSAGQWRSAMGAHLQGRLYSSLCLQLHPPWCLRAVYRAAMMDNQRHWPMPRRASTKSVPSRQAHASRTPARRCRHRCSVHSAQRRCHSLLCSHCVVAWRLGCRGVAGLSAPTQQLRRGWRGSRAVLDGSVRVELAVTAPEAATCGLRQHTKQLVRGFVRAQNTRPDWLT